MNFALLGDAPGVVGLLQAIAKRPEHRLTHAAVVGPLATNVRRLAPSVRVVERWEELLVVDAAVDALIVAGDDAEVLTAAKHVGLSCRGIMVLPQASHGLGFVYELTLLSDDSHVVLFPAFPLQGSPHVGDLKRMLADGALGNVYQLEFERTWPDVAAGGNAASPPAERPLADVQLHDVDLLGFLGGDYDQVTALRSAPEIGRAGRASLALAGENCPDAHWTIKPATGACRGQLTVSGSRGTAVLDFGTESTTLTTRIDGAESTSQKPADAAAIGETWLQGFVAAVAGEDVRPNWTDATRAFEIIDAARRSIRRRRTIDLNLETTSERSIFKSQMTALGCGVLSLTLFCLLLLLLLGAVLGRGDGEFGWKDLVLRLARWLWLLPLVVFLLLQLLLFVAKPSSTAKK